MKIAEIRKMVMIPEERYDRMLESYDKAVNTTGKLVKEVSAMQAELDRRTIIENEAILLISKCRFLEHGVAGNDLEEVSNEKSEMKEKY